MAPEEQEIALVVQRDDLPALKLGQRWEEVLKHLANGVTKRGDEAVEDELWVVRCGASMVLQVDVSDNLNGFDVHVQRFVLSVQRT